MAASPTGRTPRTIWTSARQDVYNQMKADYDSNPANPPTLGGRLYKYASQQASNTNNGLDIIGMWPTLMYQMTGDVSWAANAIARLKGNSFWTHHVSYWYGNPVREYGQALAWMYDWLWPGISAQDRADFATRANTLFASCANGGESGPGGGNQTSLNVRLGDTDQMTGEYTALGMWAIAAGEEYPDALTYFATVGGATPDAAYASVQPLRHPLHGGTPSPYTARMALQYYVGRMAAGGVWHESSHYDLGTVQLLVFGAEGIKSAYPSEMSDVTAWYPGACKRQMFASTNDFNHSVQYGDVEAGKLRNEMVNYHWISLSMMLAGVAQGDDVGPYMQGHTMAHLAAKGVPFQTISTVPVPRALALFNPYAPTSDYAQIGQTYFAQGQGQLFVKDSWASSGSLTWLQYMPACITVHHKPYWSGHFQIYRRNHWAFDAPLQYGSAAPPVNDSGNSAYPGSVNGMRLFGFYLRPPGAGGSSFTTNEAVDGFNRVWSKLGADWAYLAGTSGGQVHPTGVYFNPPPTCCHEYSRSFLKLTSTDGSSDVIVIFDRVNCKDPRDPTLLPYNYLETASFKEKTLIANAIARKEWIFFTNQAPIVQGVQSSHAQTFTSSMGVVRWTDIGGDPAQVEALLPTGQNRRVQDWNVIAGTAYAPSERDHWRITQYPATDQQWDVFLNVVSCYNNGGVAPTSTLITGTQNMSGCLVNRSGQDNRVVMFNGTQGAELPLFNTYATMKGILDVVRFQANSFNFGYTQTTTWCKALVCDLSPSITWTYTVNGGSASALSIGSDGVGEISVNGTGAKTIALIANGEAPPDPPENPVGVKRTVSRMRLKLRVPA